MLTRVRKSLRDEKGQGMTEYIIIVILIALAVLVFTRFLGSKVGEKTSEAGEKVGSLTIPP
jgi:Flp pilus assembly pilin Flp